MSANSLKEVGYCFPKIEVIKERFLSNLVDTVGYSTQTSCLLQILLKPLLVSVVCFFVSWVVLRLIFNAGPMLIAVFITEMVILHKYVYLLLLLLFRAFPVSCSSTAYSLYIDHI